MKKILETYNSNKLSVQFYIKSLLSRFNTSSMEENAIKYILNSDKAIEVIYYVDNDYKQITPSYWKNYTEEEREGIDKSYYFNIASFKENTHISNPYLHYQTGRPTLTVAKKEENGYLVIDFDILKLLEELKLIEHNSTIEKINKYIMSISGIILGLVALFLIIYGFWIFVNILFLEKGGDVLHQIFSSVISITIGIAIYDLAKTFIENEVIFKQLNYANTNQSKTLIKFLQSIIIALSIESLMAVFKIVLSDSNQIINAFYLILGVTLLIVGTGIYTFLSNTKRKD